MFSALTSNKQLPELVDSALYVNSKQQKELRVEFPARGWGATNATTFYDAASNAVCFTQRSERTGFLQQRKLVQGTNVVATLRGKPLGGWQLFRGDGAAEHRLIGDVYPKRAQKHCGRIVLAPPPHQAKKQLPELYLLAHGRQITVYEKAMSARKDRVLAVISRRPLMTSRAKPTTGQALYVLVEAGVDVAFIASLLMVVDCQCMFDEP